MLSLVSEIARFLGSAMDIAIANRKNRCDFGALRAPWPSNPCFFRFPCFFDFRFPLLFWGVFPFFSKDFRGSAKRKNLAFWGVLPCFFPKKQGLEGQGLWVRQSLPNFVRLRHSSHEGARMLLLSGIAPANQTNERPIRKPVRELGVFSWIRRVFPGETRRLHKNPHIRELHQFFWILLVFFQEKHSELTETPQFREPACESAFLWFGLPGRLLMVYPGIWHINNFSVTPVTDLPGPSTGWQCLCSLGCARSTHPGNHQTKLFMFMCLFRFQFSSTAPKAVVCHYHSIVVTACTVSLPLFSVATPADRRGHNEQPFWGVRIMCGD